MNSKLLYPARSLTTFNGFASQDLEETRFFISELFVPHKLEIVGREAPLDAVIGKTHIDGVSFIYHKHGAAVKIQPQLFNDFFLLQIPIYGHGEVLVGNEVVPCDLQRSVMLPATRYSRMQFDAQCEQLIVRIERKKVEEQLEKHLGRQIQKQIIFCPTIRVGEKKYWQLFHMLQFILISLTHNFDAFKSETTNKLMISFFLSILIENLDHNYKEMLNNINVPLPACIKKARDYIEQNCEAAITPADIAASANISVRSLYYGFRRYFGVTPSQYLKNTRLDLVHNCLMSAGEKQIRSVSELAMNYGFIHLGHFTESYKKRFKKLPSETLRYS